MKKNDRFGSHLGKRDDEEKQRALEFDDAGEGDVGYDRGSILESIQLLLLGSYEFNFNPLPQLRKFFPRFDWRFHDFDHLDGDNDRRDPALQDMVWNADFFWMVHGGTHNIWVTASRKDHVPRRLRIFGGGALDSVFKNDPKFRTLLTEKCGVEEFWVDTKCNFVHNLREMRK